MSEPRIVLVSGARTPIGSFGGALAGVDAYELGAVAVTEALARPGSRRMPSTRSSWDASPRTVPTPTTPAASRSPRGFPRACPRSPSTACAAGPAGDLVGSSRTALGWHRRRGRRWRREHVAHALPRVRRPRQRPPRRPHAPRRHPRDPHRPPSAAGTWARRPRRWHPVLLLRLARGAGRLRRREPASGRDGCRSRGVREEESGRDHRGRRSVEVSVDEPPAPRNHDGGPGGLAAGFEKDGSVTAGNSSGINDGPPPRPCS